MVAEWFVVVSSFLKCLFQRKVHIIKINFKKEIISRKVSLATQIKRNFFWKASDLDLQGFKRIINCTAYLQNTFYYLNSSSLNRLILTME